MTDPPAPGEGEGKRPSSPLRNVAELVLTVVVAIGVALLVQALLVKPYKIPSGSMIPTLQIHQRILVNRLDTHPGLGAIVVFHPPAGADVGPEGTCGSREQGLGHPQACDRDYGGTSSETYVKRLVGLPGDHLRIVNGEVFRDGVRERGSYIQPCSTGSTYCSFPTTITVPAGYYYMMGDNRGVSDDSRFWGPVPQSAIIGTAFFTYWPIDRIGTL
ncbi:MAG TPA: signal peptidase I [Solirubrobacteraceae bacterium]|jgi:signal peptidase I|nr:signal peptidase I [Solirubrobacteraceae bacterium]